MAAPHRIPAKRDESTVLGDPPVRLGLDTPVYALFAVLSVGRLVVGVLHHEVFGAEMTIALFVALLASSSLLSAFRRPAAGA
jgi:hypothetical protein